MPTIQDLQQLVLQGRALFSAGRRKLCEDKFEGFIHVYLKGLTSAKSPDFHREMMKLNKRMVVKGDWKQHNRLLFIAPRGFAKSTICSVMYPLWLALYGKRKDIFLVSATISLAKEMLGKIRNELENNELLLEDFGEVKSDKWTEDILMLKNGVKIRAKGRGFQIRGFRPDMIICDDLEDEEVIYSKEQRDKLEAWFFRTLLPALKPDQSLLYVGTNLHTSSLIVKLKEKPEFEHRFYRALENNRSIWEDYWPTDKLIALKKELGEYAFQAEYQNNPISLEDQPIKPHMLEGVSVRGKKAYRCMAIDPAISEKTGADFRSIVIFDRYEDEEEGVTGFREVFSAHGKWGLDEQCDIMLDAFERHHPDRVIIEEVAFQQVFRRVLVEKGRKRKLFLPISEAFLGISRPESKQSKKPKDKFTRLMGVVHLFEQKFVEVINPELKDELIAFPHGDYDDLVDATVYALHWLMTYQTGRRMVKKMDAALPKEIKPRESYYIEEVRPGVWYTKTAGDPPVRTRKVLINYDKRS